MKNFEELVKRLLNSETEAFYNEDARFFIACINRGLLKPELRERTDYSDNEISMVIVKKNVIDPLTADGKAVLIKA